MSTELTTIDPRVAQELRVVTEAIEVSLAIREVTVDFSKRKEELTAIVYSHTKPPTNDEEMEVIKLDKRAVAKLRTEFDKKVDALKAPLNAALDSINATKKAQIELLKKCEQHGEGLINFYQRKLTDIRNAELERIEAERKRLADQAAQAEREQQEAERKRQAAALAEQQAHEATTKAARDKAAAEALRLTREAEALDTAAYEKEIEAAMAPMAQAVSAPAPQAKEIRDFEIRGRTPQEQKESLIALLFDCPDLFSAEIHAETPRSFMLRLRIADLTDSLNGKEPFQKLESAAGINVTTRLSTLR